MKNQSVGTSLNLFVSSSRREIILAREALLTSSSENLDEAIDKLKSSRVVQDIVSMASSSSLYIEGIVDKVTELMPGIEVIRGLTIVAAGAAVWGLSYALAPVIAVLLIAYGISIAFPNAQELIVNKFEAMISI